MRLMMIVASGGREKYGKKEKRIIICSGVATAGYVTDCAAFCSNIAFLDIVC